MGSQDLGGGPSCVTFIVKTNQPKLKPKPKQKTGMCLIGLSDIVLPVALKLQSVPDPSQKFMKT